MSHKSAEKKSIQEILGLFVSEKSQVSFKLTTKTINRLLEASDVLDVFQCDLHEAALTKLLDELQPLIDSKKSGGKIEKTIHQHGEKASPTQKKQKAQPGKTR